MARINRPTLSIEAINALLTSHKELLQKYKVKRIGLFGSHVRQSQNKRSDIDFLVEFEKPSFDNYMDLLFSLESLFGKSIDLVTHNGLSPYMRPYVENEVKWHEV